MLLTDFIKSEESKEGKTIYVEKVSSIYQAVLLGIKEIKVAKAGQVEIRCEKKIMFVVDYRSGQGSFYIKKNSWERFNADTTRIRVISKEDALSQVIDYIIEYILKN